ncbi:alpha/beta hydrolase family protein [Noviherbaspirillum sp. ST9]|uniref:alpha/beta hydrolase family protein n=1 Tax=Noviherbaspirillum sp. ST9 TaxID=3401606 RepID=UPI003B586E6D
MTSRPVRSAWLAAALCAAAGAFAATASAQTSFSATYSGAGINGGSCTSTYNISGMEPADTGTHPVFVYMVGTAETYTNAAAMEAVRRMAAKGYVAATIEYASSQFGTCSVISGKASCVFNPANAASAVSQLCSRARADCSKGIVVAGFSQGSIMAILAKNFDARVQAAYGIGAGVQYSAYDLRSCVANGNRVLHSDRLRAVNGERDNFNGGTASAARSQLQELTGLNCGSTAYGCLSPNNSGWLIVKNAQVADRSADHCYMRRSGDCLGSQNSLDAGWQGGTTNWQLESNLQWLTTFTAK